MHLLYMSFCVVDSSMLCRHVLPLLQVTTIDQKNPEEWEGADADAVWLPQPPAFEGQVPRVQVPEQGHLLRQPVRCHWPQHHPRGGHSQRRHARWPPGMSWSMREARRASLAVFFSVLAQPSGKALSES